MAKLGMGGREKLKVVVCRKCGHKWKPQRYLSEGNPRAPFQCPRCKSVLERGGYEVVEV